jgi:HSP20 family protein
MDYIKIRLRTDLDQLGSKFERNIGEMFQSMNPIFTLNERSWKPQVDIYETPEEIILLSELAGIDKDELELEVNSSALKISGKRRFAFSKESTSYCLAEIQYGTFERILVLPSPIDTDVVSASFSNGILQIRMAKWFVDKARRIIID